MLLYLTAFCASVCGVGGDFGNRVTNEQVDLIELNHFFDPRGQHVYDQVIFYQVAPETGKFHVRAWCLVEDRESLSRRPIKNQNTEQYQVEWYDNDHRILRRIKSQQFRESWTQIDPERVDKKILEERSRLSLIQSPQRVQAERQVQAELRQQEEQLAEQSSKNDVNAAGHPTVLVSQR